MSEVHASREKLKSILKDDEKILKEFYPNKARGLYLALIVPFIVVLVGALLVLFGILNGAGALDWFPPAYSNGHIEDSPSFLVLLVPGIILLCIGLVSILSVNLSFRKYCFVVTDRRIICGHGVIGQDYSLIEFEQINAVEVYVNLLDKINGSKTGSVIFLRNGSMMYYDNRTYTGFPYAFRHIENPYEAYKEIQQLIDANKKDKSKDSSKAKETKEEKEEK